MSGAGVDLVVEVPVANVGDRPGSEVVQVYVGADEPVVPRPEKELAGFAKVTLGAGQNATATIALKHRSFARWDPGTHEWVVDTGRYRIQVAASATDIRGELEVDV